MAIANKHVTFFLSHINTSVSNFITMKLNDSRQGSYHKYGTVVMTVDKGLIIRYGIIVKENITNQNGM